MGIVNLNNKGKGNNLYNSNAKANHLNNRGTIKTYDSSKVIHLVKKARIVNDRKNYLMSYNENNSSNDDSKDDEDTTPDVPDVDPSDDPEPDPEPTPTPTRGLQNPYGKTVVTVVATDCLKDDIYTNFNDPDWKENETDEIYVCHTISEINDAIETINDKGYLCNIYFGDECGVTNLAEFDQWHTGYYYNGEETIESIICGTGQLSILRLYLGDCITSIMGCSFMYRDNDLREVRFPQYITEIPDNFFTDCYCVNIAHIPPHVETIGEAAFSDCFSLTEVDIPDSVTSLGDQAFYNCGDLETVTIGSGVTTIPENCFLNDKGLKTVIISEGCTSIGDAAFAIQAQLSGDVQDMSITIPSTVTTIGTNVFGGRRANSHTTITINKPENSIAGAPWGSGSNATVIWTG